jgi:hypothetical protein
MLIFMGSSLMLSPAKHSIGITFYNKAHFFVAADTIEDPAAQ